MAVEMVGRQIAALRKEKGVRQEDLAAFVGVTAQAVSKWENGGAPDAELLPVIADFFGVSIDALFGYTCIQAEDVYEQIQKRIDQKPQEERFAEAIECCWAVEQALFGHGVKKDALASCTKQMHRDSQTYSSVCTDDGFTRMGVGNRMQYFFLMPDTEDKQKALLEDMDYPAFFAAFSERDVFRACVMLHGRESRKAFTEKLLMQQLDIGPEKAKEVAGVLLKYHLLSQMQIETEEAEQTVYQFRETPSFVAFLVFAREMIQPPNSFYCYKGGRGKPYL